MLFTESIALNYIVKTQNVHVGLYGREFPVRSLLAFMADAKTLGILVHGDNHFIVRGPLPDREAALALARHWTIIQIGGTTPEALQQWTIRTREFRENLEWAVIVPGDGEVTPGVAQLLEELSARGIVIHTYSQS
jgi:hypothetical protein